MVRKVVNRRYQNGERKGIHPVVVAQVDLRYPATLKEVSLNPTEYQYILNKIKI